MTCKLPAGTLGEGQEWDDGVAEALAQRTQELPVFHVIAGVHT